MTAANTLPFLSRDFEKLFETGKNPDVCIKVGKGSLVRKFPAHSLILSTRSNYFSRQIDAKAWLTPSATDSAALPVFGGPELEGISPTIFEVLLRYIYGGALPFSNRNGRHTLELLVAADKLELTDILAKLQESLVKDNYPWLVENFGLASRTAIEHSSFKTLQKCCQEITETRPEDVFACKDFLTLPEATLVELLKNDDIAMEEVEIWKRVVQWGIAQIQSLPPKIGDWSLLDFARLQTTLNACIPHIRFFQLPSAEFQDYVLPYLSVLGNQLSTDILSFYLRPAYTPKTLHAPPRYGAKSLMISKMMPRDTLDSALINKRHAALLSIWVDRKENVSPLSFRWSYIKNHYDFRLLLRGSRDGFTTRDFHRLCDDQGPTVTIVKVKDTGELLGGYNPLDWKSTESGQYFYTTDSFIFSFGDSFPRNAILSRVREPSKAVFCHRYWGPSFGVFDFGLHGNEEAKCRSASGQYECEIRPTDSGEDNGEDSVSIEEYEVFQVVKRGADKPMIRLVKQLALFCLAVSVILFSISISFCYYSICTCSIVDTVIIMKDRVLSIIV